MVYAESSLAPPRPAPEENCHEALRPIRPRAASRSLHAARGQAGQAQIRRLHRYPHRPPLVDGPAGPAGAHLQKTQERRKGRPGAAGRGHAAVRGAGQGTVAEQWSSGGEAATGMYRSAQMPFGANRTAFFMGLALRVEAECRVDAF
ncbi:conserved hypothetical protein [Ricinus communis]|uniref:Uncharacterized protein n=1 Tax=Ricinus communis TaxID=3988 RepID=B9TGV1_RICCO|nr:conserved hypothetical protein [Ricinus communis]